ncbi:MAG: flagellar biosynthesis protein FlgA [SAR324 cluster bacterium]|jgi:predicted homoserine dehydrogenase-like protein|nr:flagellar biosynthesis protein FlgA [SAR324 cluster bacterium]MDP6245373.1 flagellar biosynthesis protein FlgA [SAR324 cluster bacterium]MDP6638363.1 flagellar biosynthesis protein FlgA [SAR324 cluster bacterium]MDP7137621.1 flagellar biosynthesis protein FlgA [SAR324 cluster bacterium]MDP7331573.1 flagellar biosynthesis protein FlgA [SAR324 cluster bacterium]|tara:strand:- start:9380 stop:10726 length:1347 start_codon:yes stop_codon:yes gene_type:complete
MSLFQKLQKRAEQNKPVRVGLIGAGKFGSMYLSQVPQTPGVSVAGVVDLSPSRARSNLLKVGWSESNISSTSLDDAIRDGTTYVSDDWEGLVKHPAIDVVVESTGSPPEAVEHILASFANGKHVVNVTVEADAFCGPLLAQRATSAGVVYSLAFGDQPALICDLVDWARTCGFPVVAAGRGHKWLPHFSESTPETVWEHYGLTPEQAQRGGLNPKMFNSFLDGSKPAIESTAVANATGLTVPSDGLLYPPGSIADIPSITRPRNEGGVLEKKGMVEVISSLQPDGTPIDYDIRMGVWVTVEAETEYIQNCFEEYNAHTDPSGKYFTLYKRWHLIGLEVGMSVASVALRQEATGVAQNWVADVASTAKRDLHPGDTLDGEGGYTVWGKLLPASTSLKKGAVPLGLAHQVKVLRDVSKGSVVTWNDVSMDTSTRAYAFRKEFEKECSNWL